MLRGISYAQRSGSLPPGTSLTVVCTPSFLSQSTKFESGNSGGVTAAASGGTAPYTYAWTGSLEDLYANNPSSASTSFHWQNLGNLDSVSADFRVTATDVYGNIGYQIISISITRNDPAP